MKETQCFECEKTAAEDGLTMCPICHKHFCEDHAFKMSGVPFCSRGCAEYFFFGDPDE